jgi:glutathione S-transferase
MHAGFQALRKSCPMNFWLPVRARLQSEDVLANVRRIESLWADCRARFSHGGPFLFGGFGAADAMYAPIVSRLHSYGLKVSGGTASYMEAVMALPAWAEWRTAALKEPWILKGDEPEWPLVRGVPVA